MKPFDALLLLLALAIAVVAFSCGCMPSHPAPGRPAPEHVRVAGDEGGSGGGSGGAPAELGGGGAGGAVPEPSPYVVNGRCTIPPSPECPTEDRVGCCVDPFGGGGTFCYYAPQYTDQVETLAADCVNTYQGTWTL